jgi:sulfatase modifying factor 1
MSTRLVLAVIGLLLLATALPARAFVTAVTLQADLPQPQPVKMPITLTASATAPRAVHFKFRVGIKSGTSFGWVTLQDYSSAASYLWTPTSPATYSLVVYAREAGSSASYEKYMTLGFTINPSPLTGISLGVTPRPVQQFGRPVELSATVVGGLMPVLKFRAGIKSGNTYDWTQLRDYTSEPTYSWTPRMPGAYLLEVYARDRGSAANAFVRVPYHVMKPAAPTLAGFTPSSGLEGTEVTLMGSNFTWTTEVRFNGTAATSFTVVSPTEIIATVPVGTTTGLVSVTTPGGTATNVDEFIVPRSINPTDSAEMVWVPGGEFTMGTPYGSVWTPATQEVTLSGYWLYKYEVTVAQYRAFCAATGRVLPHFPSVYNWAGKSGWADPSLQNHPIVNVTWNEANRYADWAGVHLPTEAQWEYAARGPEGRNYPWGGTATADNWINGWDVGKCANYYNSHFVGKSTWPVGSFPAGASWCGALDMAGNSWEWCADWYGNYSSLPVTNPTGATSGDKKILRGGQWDFNEHYARGANRVPYGPTNGSGYVGIRCVSSAPGPTSPIITGFTPTSGAVGTVVTITGTRFTDAAVVRFNGIKATTFFVVSSTIITATVPIGASYGPITVATTRGSITSAELFTVTESINIRDDAEIVWVPGGDFLMGTPEGEGQSNEHPQHRVTLSGYWIYKHEVTVGQYRQFCTATGREMPSAPSPFTWQDNHPMAVVKWSDAQAYAQWAGARLPTEAEWEKAARGTDGRRYPWGNDWDQSRCANYWNSRDDAGNYTGAHLVGSFPLSASPYGAQDMAGNVYEWCSDWYQRDYYTISPAENPQGATSGTYRVVRGGSWLISGKNYTCAFRFPATPEVVYCDIGFRCVISP